MPVIKLSEAQRARILDSFARQGFLTGMAARIVALEAGRCEIEMPFAQAVAQQHGFFHGGAVGALGDSAGGYAAMTLLPDGTAQRTLCAAVQQSIVRAPIRQEEG